MTTNPHKTTFAGTFFCTECITDAGTMIVAIVRTQFILVARWAVVAVGAKTGTIVVTSTMVLSRADFIVQTERTNYTAVVARVCTIALAISCFSGTFGRLFTGTFSMTRTGKIIMNGTLVAALATRISLVACGKGGENLLTNCHNNDHYHHYHHYHCLTLFNTYICKVGSHQ